MIGAFIERVLLSEINFGHSVLLALRQNRKRAILYSAAHCCRDAAASLQRLAELTAACEALGGSSSGPAQALVPLEALTSDVGPKLPQLTLAKAHGQDAAKGGYAFLVTHERSTILYGVARCECEAPFSLEEAQRLRQFAPMVWGALIDCLHLTQNKDLSSSSEPNPYDPNAECIDRICGSSASFAHILDGFTRAHGVSLSPKETAVTSQFLRGGSAKTIAAALCISPHTVNIHMRNIYRKFHVKNRTHLHSAYADFVLAYKPSGGLMQTNPFTHSGQKIDA